ncbi:hypothetical protein THAOC_34601 [Thalassiosira oceanica]|uniref:Uncharacterized protein n=1 Tax=Thalassiosira oceanica TaxID=159749 RepID=K0RCF3_THAOC|nr:hypothetical protein THAOC_34601 [Thalassiosira oceanica]|eukprot:EJK46716.1 hypothetical protein THAOC_34601 [Thalassiosira oceanica]
MQTTCKFYNDIIPPISGLSDFQATFRGLQLVSQLYLPPKWPWIAVISSGNYDDVLSDNDTPAISLSSLSFPILVEVDSGLATKLDCPGVVAICHQFARDEPWCAAALAKPAILRCAALAALPPRPAVEPGPGYSL